METGLSSRNTKTIRRAIAAAAGASALLIAGTAQAALQDRDLDGDTVVDAFYDTDLDITWLRDANVNGQMNWATAVAWADGFTLAGYDDWRLPTSATCAGMNCIGSEMGHLYYVELGNPAGGPMTNTGGFQNLTSESRYWSGTEWAGGSDAAYAFLFRDGSQGAYIKDARDDFYALAVRDGDVAVVPEPQTAMLLLAGLTALALARRQRPL